MTLTLELPLDVETRLQELSSLHGQPPAEYALHLLDDWLREDEQDLSESVAALRQGLADLEAGDRGVLLEDYRTQLEAEYQRQDEASVSLAAA